MERSVNVFHISEVNEESGQSNQTELKQVRLAVDAFSAGSWDAAKEYLQGVRDEDPTKKLLLKTMWELVTPPEKFKGQIPMTRK